jgi:hypothetical protein
MQRSGIWCAVAIAALTAAACNKPGEGRLESNARVGDEPGAPRVLSAEGCLTESGDRFVLTELKAEDATAEAYRLVGMDDELRPHIGKRITVAGESEPEQVVDVRQSTATPGTQAAGTAGTAQVTTTEQTRIEVHDLRVRTITPSDAPCTPAQ